MLAVDSLKQAVLFFTPFFFPFFGASLAVLVVGWGDFLWAAVGACSGWYGWEAYGVGWVRGALGEDVVCGVVWLFVSHDMDGFLGVS